MSASRWCGVVMPLAARAQQPSKLPTIGFLGAATPSAWGPYTAAFVTRLRELGWIEGRTIAIEYRWAEGRPERYAEIAAEFVRRNVDVIVTSGTAAGAVKLATSAIPIVFAVAVEPLSSGLVANLARPGGNLTGLSSQTGDLGGKRLDLLREVVPDLRRLAIMGNAGYSAAVLEMGEVQAAARALGLEVVTLEVRRAEDFAPAFEALKDRADALYVCSESLVSANRIRIVIFALAERMPTIYGERAACRSGRPDVVWSESSRPVSALRRLCRQDSARGKAGRPPSRAADQIRSRHQPDHGQGARPQSAAGSRLSQRKSIVCSFAKA